MWSFPISRQGTFHTFPCLSQSIQFCTVNFFCLGGKCIDIFLVILLNELCLFSCPKFSLFLCLEFVHLILFPIGHHWYVCSKIAFCLLPLVSSSPCFLKDTDNIQIWFPGISTVCIRSRMIAGKWSSISFLSTAPVNFAISLCIKIVVNIFQISHSYSTFWSSKYTLSLASFYLNCCCIYLWYLIHHFGNFRVNWYLSHWICQVCEYFLRNPPTQILVLPVVSNFSA